jgi:hypothetical protein
MNSSEEKQVFFAFVLGDLFAWAEQLQKEGKDVNLVPNDDQSFAGSRIDDGSMERAIKRVVGGGGLLVCKISFFFFFFFFFFAG